MKKRILAFILVLISVIGVFSACSGNNEKQETKKLSEMSDEELLKRLEEENVTIPRGYTIETARELIVALEADPDYPSDDVSAPLYVDLIEALRTFVKKYYAAARG